MERFPLNFTFEEGEEINFSFVAEGILLFVVAFLLVLDSLVIAALIADSHTVRSIRWILVNILLAGIVGALGAVLRHTFQIGRVFAVESLDGQNQIVARVYLLVINFGSAARVLMATFYAVTVFIVVKCWNKPVLAPKNTKYFIIGVVFMWILAILLSSPFIVNEIVAAFCNESLDESMKSSGIYATVPFIVLSTIPIFLTLFFLIITVCFIKQHTIKESTLTKKTLLKFGFFLIIGQGINGIGQIILPVLILGFISDSNTPVLVPVLIAIYDLSLIHTPILVIVFFKPVERKLRNWCCMCCSKHSLINAPSQDALDTI